MWVLLFHVAVDDCVGTILPNLLHRLGQPPRAVGASHSALPSRWRRIPMARDAVAGQPLAHVAFPHVYPAVHVFRRSWFAPLASNEFIAHQVPDLPRLAMDCAALPEPAAAPVRAVCNVAILVRPARMF